jgi:alpha-tubulin suppressor-like RCC1 family protein
MGGSVGGAPGGRATGGRAGTGGEGGEPDGPVVEGIALGSYHSCIVSNRHTARCWGSNGDGQLGLPNADKVGDDELPASAPDVDLGGPVAALSAGALHTCALLVSGAVRCFGRGVEGQLGYGNIDTIGDDETPASAGDVALGEPAIQIAAGSYHTCALLESGSVRCWGEASHGELGLGSTERIGDDETPASAPAVDVGGGRVVAVHAGLSHTCVLLATGRVRCWGYAHQGRLGYGNEDNVGDDEPPSRAGDVDIGGVALKIDLGTYHTCALLTDGALRCWGGGFYGETGHGNRDLVGDDETAASVPPVDFGGAAVDVATGGHHTCVLLDEGRVRCWGDGNYGEIGQGNRERIGDDEFPSVAQDVDLGGPALRIATGAIHTCALLDTGALRCFGEASSGQLGYGNTENIGDDEAPASAGDVSVFPSE